MVVDDCKKTSMGSMVFRFVISFFMFWLLLLLLQEYTGTDISQTIELVQWILLGLGLALPFALLINERIRR